MKSVTNPKHYSRWKIEPLEFIMANGLGFVPGNIIKYVMRYDQKDGLQDLIKAETYLKRLIAQVKRQPRYWTK